MRPMLQSCGMGKVGLDSVSWDMSKRESWFDETAFWDCLEVYASPRKALRGANLGLEPRTHA